MQVVKQYFFGEALYILCNYEKGRCNFRKLWWGKKYINSLKDSISFMGEMVESLSIKSISPRDYEIVQKIIEDKTIFRFNKLLLNQWKENSYSLSSLQNPLSYDEVNELISSIIERLNNAIQELDKKSKQNIWYWLHALHNLSKIYLSSQRESVFGSLPPAISCTLALQYAKSYLKMVIMD